MTTYLEINEWGQVETDTSEDNYQKFYDPLAAEYMMMHLPSGGDRHLVKTNCRNVPDSREAEYMMMHRLVVHKYFY